MKAKLPITILALVLLLMFAVTGCFLIPDAGEGSLGIQFPSARDMAQNIVWDTDLDMEIASYTISGSGPLEESFSVENFIEDTFTEDGLAVGEWEIVIDGYNAGGDHVGTTTIETTIRKSQTSTESAALSPLTGKGDLEISVEWTDSESKMDNPQVLVTLRDENGEDITDISDPVELTVVGQTASAMISDLPTGWYEVTVELNEGVSEAAARYLPPTPTLTYEVVWDGVYTARIVKDQTTEGSVTVAENLIVFGTAETFTLRFDANEGTGTMDSVDLETDEQTMLPSNVFTREGYIFAGWAASATGTAAYDDEDDYTMGTSDATLYAKWREPTVGDLGPAGGYIFYDDTVGYDFNGDSTIASTEKDLLDGTNDGTVSGDRYLEAAPYGWYNDEDDPAFQWGAVDYDVTPSATATGVGAGKTNTENIVSYHDNLGELYQDKGDYYTNPTYYSQDNDGSVAAKVCDEYTVTENGTVYDDWFLPSKDELDLMRENLHLQGLGGFSSSYYWSSSEGDDDFAWGQDFTDGNQSSYYKDYVDRVRAVRAY
jgi:uncharacterized repeat protein (TIGR02543 family)